MASVPLSKIYLLDTNIISQLMRQPQGPQALSYRNHVAGLASGQIATSIIVHCELLFGLRKKPSTRMQQAFELQMAQLPVLGLDNAVAAQYAQLRCALEQLGTPIGANDCLIAAHALALGATLVSADAEFARVAGLKLENWLIEPV
jgi:tRNA(fMet)-specific endonuclease VapC